MELKIIKVNNKSNPVVEFVSIEVLEATNLKNFMICDNTFDEHDSPSNLYRHFYSFPHQVVKAGDLVVLYSKLKYGTKSSRKNGGTIYRFDWGLNNCVWNDEGDTAHLIKIANSLPFKVKKAE